MRTRGHSPGIERAAKALGKAGNNGAVWVVLGVVAGARSTLERARPG